MLSSGCSNGESAKRTSGWSSQRGETIETYPTDKPFPSRLILGWSGLRPLHVVAADNASAQETIIVTVYQPDIEEWESGFKRRKRR